MATPKIDTQVPENVEYVTYVSETDGKTYAGPKRTLAEGTNLKYYDYSQSINKESDLKKYHQFTLYCGGKDIGKDYNHKERTLTSQFMLIGNLPPQITYSINNNFEAPLSFGMSGMVNLVAQSMLGTSSGFRATTIKIWSGTDPLKISITLPIIDDNGNTSGTNFQECLEVLGRYALPEYNGKYGTYTNVPGSGGLNVWYNNSKGERTRLGEAGNNRSRITAQFGGILFMDWCAIEGFTVNYPNTKALILHDYGVANQGFKLLPLLAELTIKLTTLEGLTKTNFLNMLRLKNQSNAVITLDTDDIPIVGKVIDSTINAVSSAWDYVSGGGTPNKEEG